MEYLKYRAVNLLIRKMFHFVHSLEHWLLAEIGETSGINKLILILVIGHAYACLLNWTIQTV